MYNLERALNRMGKGKVFVCVYFALFLSINFLFLSSFRRFSFHPSLTFFPSIRRGYEKQKSGKRDSREGGNVDTTHERNTITLNIIFIDSGVYLQKLRFGIKENDALFTYISASGIYLFTVESWLLVEWRNDDVMMMSAKYSDNFLLAVTRSHS